jgi:sugar phosphate permease
MKTNSKPKAILGVIAMCIMVSFCTFNHPAAALIRGQIGEMNGISTTAMSAYFSCYSLGSAIAAWLLSKIVPKLDYKKTAIVAAIAPVITFSLFPFIKNQALLWVLGVVSGTISQLCGFICYSLFVNSWFNKGRATMMSLGIIVYNIFIMVVIPICTNIVQKYGPVRFSVSYGIVATAIMLIIAIFLLPNSPQKYGMEPVDIIKKKEKTTENKKEPSAQEEYNPSMPASSMLKYPVIILMMLLPAIMAFAISMYTSNYIAMYESYGVSYSEAAYCHSLTSAASFPSGTGFYSESIVS